MQHKFWRKRQKNKSNNKLKVFYTEKKYSKWISLDDTKYMWQMV